MSQVGVGDHAEMLEFLEIAVDGGEVHIGGPLLDRLGQLLGAHVAIGLKQHLETGSAELR